MKRKLTLIYHFLYGLCSDLTGLDTHILSGWHSGISSPTLLSGWVKTNAEKVTHNPRDHLPQPYHGCCSGAARQHTTAMRPSPWLLASDAVLSPAHWSLTVSCSPSHTTNCNNAHAPGRFHLQPYKVQACQEKNNQNLPMSRCRYHGRCRSSRPVDRRKIHKDRHILG